jgi:hypothetical protein
MRHVMSGLSAMANAARISPVADRDGVQRTQAKMGTAQCIAKTEDVSVPR